MRFHIYFSPGDIRKASNELDCIIDLSKRALNHAQSGEFELAKERYQDVIRSLNAMSQMARKQVVK